MQFAKTSKSVSKDIERAGDQAERIGKILGYAMSVATLPQARRSPVRRGAATPSLNAAAAARAIGVAAAGLAGGLALGTRARGQGRQDRPARRPPAAVLGVPVGRKPAAVAAAQALAGGVQRLAAAGGHASRAAEDVHELRAQLEQLNRRSPVEVLLDGLTHRRGGHRREG